MTPTIVFRAGKPFLTLGGSGGPRIITSVLQVMLNTIDRYKPLDEAMSALRLHHQWQPDEVFFDHQPPAELAKRLEESGHKLSDKHKTGIIQAIMFMQDGSAVGASDPRKGGKPAIPD